MIITSEITNEDVINDILEMANNRFDFVELGITTDQGKIKHWMNRMSEDEVNNSRRRKASSQTQFTSANGEIT